MRNVKIPVRINLLGGWSDQPDWPFPAAVVNAAVGWNSNPNDPEWQYDPYPLAIIDGKLKSKVPGIGTGLGISSIYMAAKYISEHCGPGKQMNDDYIFHVLEWEKAQGTKGGWQDQIGGITPGFKLITSNDHKTFNIQRNDNHPVLERIVLFDTGVRRASKKIGDQVREQFSKPAFRNALKQNVEDAKNAFEANAGDFIKACLEGWNRLTALVPDMEMPLPKIEGTCGHMFVGAGGGGWGIYLLKPQAQKTKIIEQLNRHGLKAHNPILLHGLKSF